MSLRDQLCALIERNRAEVLNYVLDEYVGFVDARADCDEAAIREARYCLGCGIIIISGDFPFECPACFNAVCARCGDDPLTVERALSVLCKGPGCGVRLCAHHPQIETCSAECGL